MKKKNIALLILFTIIIILIFLFYSLSYNFVYKNTNYLKATVQEENPDNCPVAPSIKGVENENGNGFYDDKIKYAVSVSGLATTQINNLKIQISTYEESESTYKADGKEKKEYIGSFSGKEEIKVSDLALNKQKNYEKTFEGLTYNKITLLYGNKTCYTKYVIKSGTKINDKTRNYVLSQYAIMTNNGIINYIKDKTTVKSSDSKVLNINSNLDENSYKATSKDAKSGHEKNKTATITFNYINNEGSFDISLPNSYWTTGYLSNPLNPKKNLALSGSGKIKYTKDKNNKLMKGFEIEKKEGSKVYAMDSGTVIGIIETPNSKGTYGVTIAIGHEINGETYISTYAHLKKGSIKVKKGERVYKGQNIAEVGKTANEKKNLKKSVLFIEFKKSKKEKDGEYTYNYLKLQTLVGKDKSYVSAESEKVTKDAISDQTVKIDDKYNKPSKLLLTGKNTEKILIMSMEDKENLKFKSESEINFKIGDENIISFDAENNTISAKNVGRTTLKLMSKENKNDYDAITIVVTTSDKKIDINGDAHKKVVSNIALPSDLKGGADGTAQNIKVTEKNYYISYPSVSTSKEETKDLYKTIVARCKKKKCKENIEYSIFTNSGHGQQFDAIENDDEVTFYMNSNGTSKKFKGKNVFNGSSEYLVKFSYSKFKNNLNKVKNKSLKGVSNKYINFKNYDISVDESESIIAIRRANVITVYKLANKKDGLLGDVLSKFKVSNDGKRYQGILVSGKYVYVSISKMDAKGKIYTYDFYGNKIKDNTHTFYENKLGTELEGISLYNGKIYFVSANKKSKKSPDKVNSIWRINK